MDLENILKELTALTEAMEHNSFTSPQIKPELRLNTPMFTLESELKKYPFNLKIGHLNTVSIPKRRDEISRLMNLFQIFVF